MTHYPDYDHDPEVLVTSNGDPYCRTCQDQVDDFECLPYWPCKTALRHAAPRYV